MNTSKTISLLCIALLASAGSALAVGCSGGGCPNAKTQSPAPAGGRAGSEHCHYLEVRSLVADGPAATAGVLPGDVLADYNGISVGCRADLARAQAGVTTESIAVSFRRGNRPVKLLLPSGKLGIFFDEFRQDVVPAADARVLPGVARLGWGMDKDNSFIGALDALLRQQGDTAGYVLLSGASGAAFRTHFFETWCPSSPDPTCGFDAGTAALESRGYSARVLTDASDGKNRAEILAAVRASIDAGMPALGLGLIEVAEWGVITGYQDNGQQLFCRTYFDKRKGYDVAQNFPEVVIILSRAAQPAAGPALTRRSFAAVARMLSAEKYGEYHNGLAAFDRWMARLGTDDFAAMDSLQFSYAVQTNNWVFNRLCTDRRTGIAWLERAGSEVPAARPLCDSLAALYRAEAELLEPLLPDLPCPASVTRADQWTSAMKQTEITALGRARDIEQAALGCWQRLAALK
jgi:hypothetical protein